VDGHDVKDASGLASPLANWQRAILVEVAILAAIYGAALLWNVIDVLFLVPRTGSGGIGAVSTSVAQPSSLLGLGLFVASVVANRRLARWARSQTRAVAALHRGQTIALQILAAAIVAFVLLAVRGLMSDFRLGIAIALLAELAFAAQWLLLAPILTIFAIRAPSSAT
jgi:hypothetical protein